MSRTTRTTCPYCGVGCGVLATETADGRIEIEGDPDHPANFGRLCSKGSALADTLIHDGRLRQPMIDGMQVSFDQALDHVADQFADIIAEHGANAVAFYASGQLLTEDYYVLNKLAKGFLGTANLDTNSRLCMASAVAAYKRAFGTDTVPCSYTDLDEADLVIITGANLAWCHPVLFQRLMAARENRPHMRIVVVDPRRTATVEGADLHLQLNPGSDGWLFNHLLCLMADAGRLNPVQSNGLEQTLEAASRSAKDLAAATGLDSATLRQFEGMVLTAPKILTLFSMGINQSTSGTDKCNAIVNFHLATGQIGRPGCGPFSITGQPNAMGGREVGGLANQLAAHVDFNDTDSAALIAEHWQAESMATRPGLMAVDMFDAVRSGEIKAIWIMGTNPVVSLPDSHKVKEALQTCPFVVVSDCIANTDTSKHAHVLLPAAGWGEKDGTVTNSERRISRQRAIQPLSGDARPDWWIVKEVAKRLGFANAFAYERPADIFQEHAAITKLVAKDLDLGELVHADYDALQPYQWHATRPFGNGRFFTPDGKARMIPVIPRLPAAIKVSRSLWLNTGRYRDQWHTMTRTGLAATLSRHRREPLLEINPVDAGDYADGDLVRVTQGARQTVLRLHLNTEIAPGSAFAPMHWNGSFRAGLGINTVINAALDPISGQPEFKASLCSIQTADLPWKAFVLTRHPLDKSGFDYWSSSRVAAGELVELAHHVDASVSLCAQIGFSSDRAWSCFKDDHSANFRAIRLKDNSLDAAVFIGDMPEREWLAERLGQLITEQDHPYLLAGIRPGEDRGALVCSCFAVHATEIQNAHAQGALSVSAIGKCLKAGTNCGSCRPEIQALLTAGAPAQRVAA